MCYYVLIINVKKPDNRFYFVMNVMIPVQMSAHAKKKTLIQNVIIFVLFMYFS